VADELREHYDFTEVRKVQPRNWCDFGTGTSWAHYAESFGRNNEARTEVCFDMKNNRQANKACFDALAKDKAAIEREFGEPLRWERLDKGSWSRIAAYRPGSIEDRKTLPEIHTWVIDRLLKFKKVALREVVWVSSGTFGYDGTVRSPAACR
jgi:hypothetical protein